MKDLDFVAIARQCQEEMKEKNTISGEKRYNRTIFVSISDDGVMECSIKPEILEGAQRCVLIHSCEENPCKRWYSRHYFQMIDEYGCIYEDEEDFGDGFSVSICQEAFGQLPSLSLCKGDQLLYSCHPPYEKEIAKFWKVYLRARECSTTEEANLFCRLLEKSDEILELKRENDELQYANALVTMERDMYRSLLEDIKRMVEER